MQDTSLYSIMVVDDIESNIDLILEALGDDYDMRVAIDSETALNDILSDPPDLVLLDIMMPGMDGYQLCQHLKENERTRELPVIFITALKETDNEARGLEIGAIDYLTKPINPVTLKARVKNHLAAKRQRDLAVRQDPLTQLYNRRYFLSQLSTIVSEETFDTVALLLIQLDRFTKLNLQFDLNQIDEFIVSVAEILRSFADQNDQLAYLGGDGFALLASRLQVQEIQQLAEQIRAQLHQHSARIGQQVAFSPCSIGVAINQQQGSSALLEQVSLACFSAYDAGGNRVQFHQEEQQKQAEKMQRHAKVLKRSLQENRFRLYFQPILSLHPQTLFPYYEVQLRLLLPNEHELPFEQFLPIAKANQLTTLLDHYLILNLLDYLQRQSKATKQEPLFLLQIDLETLLQPRFLTWLQHQFTRFALPTKQLVFEIAFEQAKDAPPALAEAARIWQMIGGQIALGHCPLEKKLLNLAEQLKANWIRFDPSAIDNTGQDHLYELIEQLANQATQSIITGISEPAMLAFIWQKNLGFIQSDLIQPPSQQLDFDFSLQTIDE